MSSTAVLHPLREQERKGISFYLLLGEQGNGGSGIFSESLKTAEGKAKSAVPGPSFLPSTPLGIKGSLSLTLPTPLRREISARIGAMNQEVTAPALPLGALHRHNRPLPRTLDFYNTSSSYDAHSAVCSG